MQVLRNQVGQTTCEMLVDSIQQSEVNLKPVYYPNKKVRQFINEYEALMNKEKS